MNPWKDKILAYNRVKAEEAQRAADFMTLLKALPPGQRKQLLKDEACAAILEKYMDVWNGTDGEAIPFMGGMSLEAGKYYTQDGAVYKCVINTQTQARHRLKDMVGIYVKEVT